MCEVRTLQVEKLTTESLQSFVDFVKESNAGIGMMAGGKRDGPRTWAVVVIDGEETQEVLDAIDVATAHWGD